MTENECFTSSSIYDSFSTFYLKANVELYTGISTWIAKR